MNPQPTRKELESYYGEDYEPFDPGDKTDDEAAARRAMQTGVLRHIEIPEGKRLLDVGCGGGWFMRIARRLGADVHGVEPSPIAAERARGHGLDVYNGTLETYLEERPDHEPFDLITASHVLEHVSDPVQTLRGMKQLLAPGGTIWISVPNASSWARRKLGTEWYSVDLPYHLQQFAPGSLSQSAERAGLSVHSQSTHSMPRAAAASMALYLRRHYLIPRRVTTKLGLDTWLAGRLVHNIDRQDRGEAIHIELTS